MLDTRKKSIVGPNGSIGILGGGQLGRMLSIAAARMGLHTHIYCPDPDCPAQEVAKSFTHASYTDEEMLRSFAQAVDVVTYEFENVPAETVSLLNRAGMDVAPGGKALEIAQDRLLEKQFVESLGGKTPLYHPVDDLTSLEVGLEKTGRPAILKTRRLGYDGKGQTRIGNHLDNLTATWEEANRHAWEAVGARPSILEAFVPFEREISVIAARARDGSIAIFDPSENEHRDGILYRSHAPANISEKTRDTAQELTRAMLETLEYVGVIGVEFFVLSDGDLLVNEFAPRVHNSGHWTDEACTISQFEQHIRAVCGWPLGDVRRHSNVVMENIIGDDFDAWEKIATDPEQILHLYGKKNARPGRKMGHVTRLSPKE